MKENGQNTDLDIAIIGMSGRFPKAGSIDAFWKNLREGLECIEFFQNQALVQAGYTEQEIADSTLIKAASVLDNIEMFDAHFFGYSPRDVELMDPQQRLFLECSWEAFEDAGYNPHAFPGMIGVYAGSGINTYLFALAQAEGSPALDGLQLTIGNDKDYLATRVSYELNLRGPSIGIQTACSTSLVAVHLACQGLLDYECDMALAGGVSIRAPQPLAYKYMPGGIASPDGHCRTFDADAQGTIFGNGVGVVMLKRFADAIRDRDHIYAVIKGSAINNDGARKAGYTAPSMDGQVNVIRAALAAADLEPGSISYIETHGTATPLGDSIEVAALKEVFRGVKTGSGSCVLGAVKTNVGHLDTAAGVTGLIKTALALKHKMIPPNLHFRKANPELRLEESPFSVASQLSPWPVREGSLRRAGVSCFGIGGTNAHAILEEAPPRTVSGTVRPAHLLLLSARSEDAVGAAARNLARHFTINPDLPLGDVAYTLQAGRMHFKVRDAIVCSSLEEAVSALEKPRQPVTLQDAGPEVVFMFPGQGTQHTNMAAGLYESEPVFRRNVDACAQLLMPDLGKDIRSILYPGTSGDQAAEELRNTLYAQPALFAVQYSLAQLWMEWGLRPAAMIGHSIGELVAACVAGVFSLEDALRIVAARARFMQLQPQGSMLAVSLPEQEAVKLCGSRLSVAAVNGPSLCVLSGPKQDIEEVRMKLDREGVSSRSLATSHAFHSAMMDEAVAPFKKFLQSVSFQSPRIPFISVNGEWIQNQEAVDPAYWALQVRKTVRFSKGIQTLMQTAGALFLELGPMQTLCKLALQHRRDGVLVKAVPSLAEPGGMDDGTSLMSAAGELWRQGVNLNWDIVNRDVNVQRVSLPTYPFERKRYWLAGRRGKNGGAAVNSSKRLPLSEWFNVPAWEKTASASLLQPRTVPAEGSWLVFSHEDGIGTEIAAALRADSRTVIEAFPCDRFERRGGFQFGMSTEADDYRKLFQALSEANQLPHTVVHCWNVTSPNPDKFTSFNERQNAGFNSLLHLTSEWRHFNPAGAASLIVLTDGLAAISENECVAPEKATMVGACRVIPQEYPGLSCRIVDLPVQNGLLSDWKAVLLDELGCQSDHDFVAYRDSQRLGLLYRRLPLRNLPPGKSLLRENGVYMITGGMGGLGIGLAKLLAKSCRAKLVLVSRSAAEKSVGPLAQQIRELEDLGAEVMVVSADVTSMEQVAAARDRALSRFSALHGVLHLAAVPGGGLMQMKTVETVSRVFEPKALGALALKQSFQNVPLDFMVCFSSITSVTGGLGQGDYAAANAFLDALPFDRSSKSAFPVISIAWDAWQSDTWQGAFLANMPELGKAFKEQREKYGITLEEGFAVLERALACAMPHYVISTQDLSSVIENHRVHAHAFLAKLAEKPQLRQADARPEGSHSKAADHPRNDTERRVLNVWKEVLGLDELGIFDNFISMGGHSLLAIQLTARLRDEFQRELGLRAIFEYPTVAELAAFIGGQSSSPATNEDEILRLLDEIEQLSQEEIRQKLVEARGTA